MGSISELPSSKSSFLHLTQPTPQEQHATWVLNSNNWGTALSRQDYLEREAYLTTVPLARDGGVTHWILVDKNLPPNERPILASCESLRKRALVSKNGAITEVVTHGIGSVFCSPEYRGKGYASRMMRELGPILNTWQTDEKKSCAFSILYSDIGKKYYAGHGWHPFPSMHIAFPPVAGKPDSTAKRLTSLDLSELCGADEQYIRRDLRNAKDGKIHVALIPDNDNMQWFHLREGFMTAKIFGRSPTIKGGLAGTPGSRVWAIWTLSFFGPLVPESGNALHILRLVVEDEKDSEENAMKLKEIVKIAQAEAAEWKLNHVEMWNPTPVAKSLVEKTGLQHSEVEREEESIASLMWYGEGSGKVDEIKWVGNEKFGWC